MQVAEAHQTDRSHFPRWLPAVGCPLLLALICVAFFWKLVFTNQYSWLDGPDLAYQVLPWFEQQARDWHRGIFPLWDPYLWGGQPLLAQAQPGAAYPLNWLLFLAPLRDGKIQLPFLHWYMVLIHVQAGLFAYWLCRDLKRTHAASLLSGLMFALGGFIGTMDWPQHLNSALWAPLILMFFLRAMRGERPVASAAWSGALLGFSLLGGHHQIPVFMGLVMAGVWIYYLVEDRSKIRLLAIFALFAALVSAVQALPSYEYGQHSLRWVGASAPVGWKDKVPYFVHQQFAFYPESIFGIVIPGIFRHTDPFVGLVGVTLAFFGVISGRGARLFGAIAASGLLLALGHNSMFHGLVYALIPGVEKARNPSMAIFIFHFGISILVAYGIDSYRTTHPALVSRLTWTIAGFATLVGLLVWGATVVQFPLDSRTGMVFFSGLLLAAILAAWRFDHISGFQAAVALGIVMLLELGNVTAYGYPVQGPASRLNELNQHDDIVAFLKNQKEPVRAEINQADIGYNFGDWHGVDHFGGYLPSLTRNVGRLVGGRPAQMLYATNFSIRKQPNFPDQVEMFTGRTGVKVYRNPAALPRVRVVHQVSAIEHDDEIVTLIESPSFDASRRTFVKGVAPRLESCNGAETVSLVGRESDRVTIDADLRCRGMVIDADTYYPGWIAIIDDKPAHLYEAYGFLRGVVVEPGRHRIELRYRPKSVYWGAALTALGLLGAAGLRVAS